ncbi:hypothetical protein PFISCL1PPCAC_8238, partial [Pristionchus fissidentatus]
MTLNNLIFIIYGIPAFLLCTLTVVSTLSIRRNLSPTFVVIYVLSTAVNLLTYLNVWLSLRLYQEPAFNFYYHFANATVVLPIIQQFLVGYCYFAQNINTFLLTIDRFVAISALDW